MTRIKRLRHRDTCHSSHTSRQQEGRALRGGQQDRGARGEPGTRSLSRKQTHCPGPHEAGRAGM